MAMLSTCWVGVLDGACGWCLSPAPAGWGAPAGPHRPHSCISKLAASAPNCLSCIHCQMICIKTDT